MLQIQKAELIDAAAIAALINSAYRGESSRQGWTTEADILDGARTTTQEIAAIIGRERTFGQHAFMLIGVLRDEIIATMMCELIEMTAHFGMIAVKPTQQNKGLGKQMIHAAEAMSRRAWGVAHYQMDVISIRTELISFYARLGYAPTGLVRPFPAESKLWHAKVPNLTLLTLEK